MTTTMSPQHARDEGKEAAPRRFYGKYRGIVTSNADPEKRGRIRASVRDVLGGEELGWALPSLPYAGKGVGAVFLPPEKTWVWIEFEQGNPDDPIWTGCFWAKDQAPEAPTVPEKKVLKTDLVTLIIDEGPGGSVSLEVSSWLRIVVSESGVEMTNGQGATIKFSGATISLNEGALEVT